MRWLLMLSGCIACLWSQDVRAWELRVGSENSTTERRRAVERGGWYDGYDYNRYPRGNQRSFRGPYYVPQQSYFYSDGYGSYFERSDYVPVYQQRRWHSGGRHQGTHRRGAYHRYHSGYRSPYYRAPAYRSPYYGEPARPSTRAGIPVGALRDRKR